MYVIIVAAITFAVLFGLDKLFGKIFRGKQQHKSGLSVKLPKRYAIVSLLLCLLGILVLMQLFNGFDRLMLFAGIVVLLMGIGFGAYYLGFGIYYDDESFVYSNFGKPSVTYRYADIDAQQLFVTTGGSILVDLFMNDGKCVGLQSTMQGVYPFLDKACHARFRQLGINSAECEWFNESESRWFPPKED